MVTISDRMNERTVKA